MSEELDFIEQLAVELGYDPEVEDISAVWEAVAEWFEERGA